jgi:SAM-dependent methyltransferase
MSTQSGGRNDFDAFYAAFSDRFRGSYEVVKRRLAVHADTLTSAGGSTGPMLDLGVGHGEWLAIAAERGWKCTGVDHNSAIAGAARARGHDVVDADALEFMASSPGSTFAAITGFHIVEHLSPEDQLRLFRESFRLLKPGGHLILEWPNVEHPWVAQYSFWFDPTHRAPLPHELVSFMAEYAGFTDRKIVRLDDGKIVDRAAMDIALYARKPAES